MSVNWSAAANVHNPLFRRGYGEVLDGIEYTVSVFWEGDDVAAYRRGRAFGEFVLKHGKAHIPLLKNNAIHPACLELMCLAQQAGALHDKASQSGQSR